MLNTRYHGRYIHKAPSMSLKDCNVKLLFLAFILTILSNSVQAVPIAITTADSLNVRAAPRGEVIDSIGMSSRVEILNFSGKWAQVVYFKGRDSRRSVGWVSVEYLQLISRGGVSLSGNCDTESQTGAEVCLDVNDAEIECDENYAGNYYQDCEVEVEYDIETDYRGESSIDTEIECEVEISLKTRESYNSNESDDESESHSLDSHDSESGSMDFDFSFSSYKEVYSVELEDVECEISDLDLH